MSDDQEQQWQRRLRRHDRKLLATVVGTLLALSSIDYLEVVPITERLRRWVRSFLGDRPNRQFPATLAVEVVSVGAITATFWISVLSQLKRMHE